MRIITFLICVLISQMAFSQIEKRNMKSGEMTLINNDKILFKDLTWKNDKAYYINANTNQPEDLFDASIKEVEEKEITIEAPVAQKIETVENDSFGYPEGVYKTKEEFINKIPSSNPKLFKRGLYGLDKPPLGDSAPICYFYDTSDSKLKYVFAVVHNSLLYFNVRAILQNRNKTDRAQDSDNPNSFVKALVGGDNYLYTEVPLGNLWAKALAYNAGVAGAAVASTLTTWKGVVWDFKNKEFNIFKNCNDYNDFIREKSPEDLLKCEDQQPNYDFVRDAMNRIK